MRFLRRGRARRLGRAALAAVGAALALAAAPVAAAEQPAAGAQKQAVAAVPGYFAPHYLLDADGQPSGFAIDLINALGREAGIRVRYQVKESWDAVFAAISNGEADLVPNLGITEERARLGEFTAPVETFNISVFVRTGQTSISQVNHLAGHKVAAVKLNVGVEIVRAMDRVTPVIYNELHEAFFALLAGHVDALIFPAPVVRRFALDAGLEDRIKTVGPPLREVKRAVLVRPGRRGLLTAFNRIIPAFVQSDKYHAIYRKWFGKAPPLLDNPARRRPGRLPIRHRHFSDFVFVQQKNPGGQQGPANIPCRTGPGAGAPA